MNLVEALIREIIRNHDLVKLYNEIPTGTFAAIAINEDIEIAITAIATNDVVQIISILSILKNNE